MWQRSKLHDLLSILAKTFISPEITYPGYTSPESIRSSLYSQSRTRIRLSYPTPGQQEVRVGVLTTLWYYTIRGKHERAVTSHQRRFATRGLKADFSPPHLLVLRGIQLFFRGGAGTFVVCLEEAYPERLQQQLGGDEDHTLLLIESCGT